MAHHDFLILLRRVYQDLLNNPNFPRLPVNLALFKAKIDEYSAAVSATMGRSTIAYSQRNSLRDELNKMLLLLAAYVDSEVNNDPAILESSGLEALPTKHVPHAPLEKPRIPKVDHGPNTGVLQVWMPPSRRKIMRYKLRHVPVDAEGLPIAEWTETVFASSQGPILIKDLKPGTVYAFQISVLGKLGETDWSDYVTKMCT
jgi:hypothetical protein